MNENDEVNNATSDTPSGAPPTSDENQAPSETPEVKSTTMSPPTPENTTQQELEVEKTPQELAAERIRLIKRTAESIDDSGLDDEIILLALARRKNTTAERSGAIQAFVERLKETR